MVKKLFLLATTFFLLNTSGICWAQTERIEPETALSAISISVKGSTIYINNANGFLLEIYSLTGTKVASFKIDNDEKTIDMSAQKGCYILKVNKVVRKIAIR